MRKLTKERFQRLSGLPINEAYGDVNEDVPADFLAKLDMLAKEALERGLSSDDVVLEFERSVQNVFWNAKSLSAEDEYANRFDSGEPKV